MSDPSKRPLSDDELEKLFDELDHSKDGYVTFQELETQFLRVHDELVPAPKEHHLTHPNRLGRASHAKTKSAPSPSRTESEQTKVDNAGTGSGGKTVVSSDQEKRAQADRNDLHDFLYSLLPRDADRVSKADFKKLVSTWDLPSQEHTDEAEEMRKDQEWSRRLSWARSLRAHWSVEGPRYAFLAFVTLCLIAFGLWQCLEYVTNAEARAALGWGVIMAKTSAGALYPSLFFMILSMSRWLLTLLRQFYWLSRFIDSDLHQAFHIYMSILSLSLATLHAIGHLTGSFIFGSRRNLEAQDALQTYLGDERRRYIDYVRSLPGWTGLTSFGIFWLIALMSMPAVRKRTFELFQLAHLLMFPMFGLLAAHGTARLLQAPMLGYWLVFPVLLVLFERSLRLIRGFIPIPARLTRVDEGTVSVTMSKTNGKDWNYQPGQYIMLQVPAVSRWQWHPFTISGVVKDKLQVHIKLEGSWTSALADLADKIAAEAGEREPKDGVDISVGLDGPFGAPAQRFYTYQKSIIIGAGIGVTPFSAILLHLEQELTSKGDPWQLSRRRSSFQSISRSMSRIPSRLSRPNSRSGSERQFGQGERGLSAQAQGMALSRASTHHQAQEGQKSGPDRRVDFHWIVRDKDQLLWLSTLLNRCSRLADETRTSGELELNIHPHITAKRKSLSTLVFRALLDRHRTKSHPYSALTGLRCRSEFGRPELGQGGILDQFDEDLCKAGNEAWPAGTDKRNRKVGVFFCGPPVIGRQIADRVHELNIENRAKGTYTRYVFHVEVF
ncbi:Ferric reductase, NADH/NADPH oxidase and related proteins [Ceraceosorus bombacis]|uniref:Ferric reductase, NADH/NADPH oxidase and related proteins n=1 Tax=Ceraceosorus bombacis TaxID=401625 RepID=A0A0P1BG28_9BASI|nr:Ferric reductase, NADH/NADPH oxidase and related proteins [Ceraceosorus bombacis]